MALVINTDYSVATAMHPVAQAALYADAVFMPEVTYTEKYYMRNAGQVQIVAYEGGDDAQVASPGANYNTAGYKNKIISIDCNTAISKSVKLPNYAVATLPGDVKYDAVVDVMKKIRLKRDQFGLAKLVEGGTISSDTSAITSTNIKDAQISLLTEARKKFVRPSIVLCSEDVYGAMLSSAGKEYVPVYNEYTLTEGNVAKWLGMTWIHTPLLDGKSSYSYINNNGVEVKVPMTGVDMIMYDYNYFSLFDVLNDLDITKAQGSSSALISCEIACGAKVTNSDCVLIHKTSTDDDDDEDEGGKEEGGGGETPPVG